MATFAVVVVSLFIVPSAAAAEVYLAGFTQGCFIRAAAFCSPPGGSMSLFGLTYTSSTFDGTSAGGVLAIGNNAGTPNLDNLGSLSLAGTPASYTGQFFTLHVTFTAPAGVDGGGHRSFSSTLSGYVGLQGNDKVFVDFDNTPTTFTFSFINPQGTTVTGSFDFMVIDAAVSAGGTAPVSGLITNAAQSGVSAVTLRSLTASRRRDRVLVRWRTASEIDALGFNVFGQFNGKRIKLNRKLIAARGLGGGTYSFQHRMVAASAAPNRVCLQVVNLDGSRSWHGARVSGG